MKEQGNNCSVELDGIFNLLSEMKEILVEQSKQSSKTDSADIALLSDRLEQLANKVETFKDKEIINHKDWLEVAGMVNLHINALVACKDVVNSKIDLWDAMQRISDGIENLKKLKNENCHSFELKTSKPFFFQVGMIVVILLLIGCVISQLNENRRLKKNDLKYRYIQMKGEISGGALDTLEIYFNQRRNEEQVTKIRKIVETFEYRSKKDSE